MENASPKPLVSGLCVTCCHVQSRLYEFTSEPWAVGFYCPIRNAPFIPHVVDCHFYEREPGSD